MKLKMEESTIYLTCNDKLPKVREFLNQFFDEKHDWGNHDGWVSFVMPATGFMLNIMDGSSQGMQKTQNVAIEISFKSLAELKYFAKKYSTEVQSFDTHKTDTPYTYYFCEIKGPSGICFIEGNFSSEIEKEISNDGYVKEFDSWNNKKQEIHKNEDYLPLYHERQVRWCKLGVNIGFEQDGTGEGFSRPVVIIKGFSRHVCWVAPLTTSKKENKYHIPLGMIGGRESYVIITQIRLIDVRRLYTKIGTVSKDKHLQIKKAIKDLL